MRKAAIVITFFLVLMAFTACIIGMKYCNYRAAVTEQALIRMLSDDAEEAIKEYYGERRQYMNDKLLSVKKVAGTPYYTAVLRVETFYGPHNPPYGIETMTFYISYGKVELRGFEHQDDD
ncbi:MAG: DUF3888 domain-containing protein [Clostridiaceae bacterium]|nr:DUF3888 domain-containing protein [Clostridiaceae bacterium]